MQPHLKVFTDAELEAVCASARRVLAQKGLKFTIPEVLAVFQKNSFDIVDANVVRIQPDQLAAALKTVPKSYVRKGAQAHRDVTIGDGVVKFAVGSLPIWVVETSPKIMRRAATVADMTQFTLLSESLDGFEIGNAVVQPQDVPDQVMHVLWNRNGSVRMTKPTCCWYGTSLETAREGLEVLRLAAGGMEELRSSRRWAITICPDSALQWGFSSIGAMVMAEAEVPIEVLPMPFLGSTHPVTLAGALVQSAAEVLGIVVLTQLVRPGCPVNYAASYGGIMDMATGSHSFGAPESALFASASTAVGKAFGLPVNMMQGTSDSKVPDVQAAVEKTMTFLTSALAQADCITMAGALLDFALSGSYEQLIIDEEIVQCVQRIVRGSQITAVTLAEKEIMGLPFGGHYVDSEHTLAHFRRELYFPRLFDRRAWENWYRDGMKDTVKRAGERIEQLLAQARPVLGVPPDRQRAVDAFVEQICREKNVNPEKFLY